MQKSLPLFIFFLLVGSISSVEVLGQGKSGHLLFLKSGTITPVENISAGALNLRKSDSSEKTFVIIQFEDIPGHRERELLKNAGIELLEYIPDYAYTATISGSPDHTVLKNANARALIYLTPEQKIAKSLLDRILAKPSQVVDSVDVRMNYPASFSFEEIVKRLRENDIKIASDIFKMYQILEIRISTNRLKELANLPFVQYIEPVPEKPVPLNDKSQANTKTNLLSSEMFGFNLLGEGVVIGIGDFGNPLQHIDLSGRVVDNNSQINDAHGVHVMGTAAGSGIVNEKYRGYAPKSQIIADNISAIWQGASTYVAEYDMVITNNSYGGSSGCPAYGFYNSEAYILDKQAFELPFLQHVFAVGNGGTLDCPDYPSGYGNITSPYSSAKNVISVGQTLTNGTVSTESSKGPSKDGRIKPELTAPGTSIFSTVPGNKYQQGTGTSMAAPAVSGGLALLYQRYRQMNGQNNPKNALMKALVCNGALDQGLAGPDYSYGFGGLNLFRSLAMLNARHYFSGQIAHKGKNQHSVSVPANTAKLKIMLYWNDPAQSLLTGEKTLVNNLDLKLSAPNKTTTLPLFPFSGNASAAAVKGIDTVNNVEQIVIDNPAEGDYSLEVSGKMIPEGTQEYFLVYDAIEASTLVTYPAGKERLGSGETININWESYSSDASNFSVQYSLNGGSNWTAIDNNVSSGIRQISWHLPVAATESAKVRIIQNQTGTIKESGLFTILGVPVVSLSTAQCESYIALQWTAVSGATDYEVMKLKGEEMVSVAITTGLTFTFSGLSRDSTYFVTVRARKNGNPGRRGVAVSRKPDNGSCAGTISDNDLQLESIISPAGSGRLFTSSALTSGHPVTIRIKNLDDQPANGPIEVGYSIGGKAIHWETINNPLSKGASLDYTFSEKLDLHAIGSYHIQVYVKKNGDPIEKNNALELNFRLIDNQPIVLPYTEQFEGMPDQEISGNFTGLQGADKYDFSSSLPEGRLRSSPPGNAYSGSRALTVDVKQRTAELNINSLTGTYNFSGYTVQTNEVILSLAYRSYGESNYNDVNLFIRGNDAAQWISIYSSWNSQLFVTNDYRVINVDISEILKQNSQEFSASFQIMLTQSGKEPAKNSSGRSGYSFDDIRFFTTESDIKIGQITVSEPTTCQDQSRPQLSVVIKNNGSVDCFNLPVSIQIDNDSPFNSTIWSIMAGSEMVLEVPYYFYIYLPSELEHKIRIWTDKAFDTNRENDSTQIVLRGSKVVEFFPHLENFEDDNGHWFTEGVNSSWQYGTADSPKVKKAASGNKIWKTNLTGQHNNQEFSYLYSPCYYISGMERPVISFSASIDLEKCQNEFCDFAYIEYCTYGNNWVRLGSSGSGTNWYNANKDGEGVWNLQDYTRWHVSTAELPKFSGAFIRFRFVLKSNNSVTREGIAIDDVHVYDLKNEIRTDGNSTAIVQEEIYRYVPINFTDENNRITASIINYNQEVSPMSVKTYLNQQPIRNSNGQYYLDRSFTISTSSKNLDEPTTVRFYIPDSEMEKLIAAPDNTGYKKPESAYDISITKFSSGIGTKEDGNLQNNAANTWTFFPSNIVKKVPYDKGYYFEFATTSFSEFWFAKGYIGQGDGLPVELISFSAKKATGTDASNQVILQWATASEKNFSHFEIEVATGAGQLRNQLFSKIGEVIGNSPQASYTWIDYLKTPVSETRYYRLKMVDTDQSFEYSAIRSVNFDQNSVWKLYPNPSKDQFNVEFRSEKNQQVKIEIFDSSGRKLKSISHNATGSVETKPISLSEKAFYPGLYLVEVTSEGRKQTFKVLKE